MAKPAVESATSLFGKWFKNNLGYLLPSIQRKTYARFLDRTHRPFCRHEDTPPASATSSHAYSPILVIFLPLNCSLRLCPRYNDVLLYDEERSMEKRDGFSHMPMLDPARNFKLVKEDWFFAQQ